MHVNTVIIKPYPDAFVCSYSLTFDRLNFSVCSQRVNSPTVCWSDSSYGVNVQILYRNIFPRYFVVTPLVYSP